MHEQMACDQSLNATHRYFPEWADRPVGPEAQHESDRNSYLACGYADEFGYGDPLGLPPAIPPLEGDPEGSRLWREQIGALHPGYPECPKPLERFGGSVAPQVSPARMIRRERHAGRAVFRIIQVRPRARDPLLRLGVIAFLIERLIRRRHLDRLL